MGRRSRVPDTVSVKEPYSHIIGFQLTLEEEEREGESARVSLSGGVGGGGPREMRI